MSGNVWWKSFRILVEWLTYKLFWLRMNAIWCWFSKQKVFSQATFPEDTSMLFFQSIKANMEPIKRLLHGKISKWLLTAMGHGFLTLALCVLFLDGRLWYQGTKDHSLLSSPQIISMPATADLTIYFLIEKGIFFTCIISTATSETLHSTQRCQHS